MFHSNSTLKFQEMNIFITLPSTIPLHVSHIVHDQQLHVLSHEQTLSVWFEAEIYKTVYYYIAIFIYKIL